MTYKTSTGLRNYMLDTGSLKSALDGGFIKIYSGAAPATADNAVTGTLLCTISLGGAGTGLTMDTTATDGVLTKPAGASWLGTNVASGTAGYYRHSDASDDGGASLTEPRLQGAISTSGAEMNLSSIALVNGAVQSLDFYSVNLPTF